VTEEEKTTNSCRLRSSAKTRWQRYSLVAVYTVEAVVLCRGARGIDLEQAKIKSGVRCVWLDGGRL
jgi:hypothetical protein